ALNAYGDNTNVFGLYAVRSCIIVRRLSMNATGSDVGSFHCFVVLLPPVPSGVPVNSVPHTPLRKNFCAHRFSFLINSLFVTNSTASVRGVNGESAFTMSSSVMSVWNAYLRAK